MADVAKITSMVQLQLGVTDPKLLPAIKDTLATAWAYLCMLNEWWFMEQPEPVAIAIQTGVFQYTINREDIGLMLHVSNDKGRKIWQYKARQSFQRYLSGRVFPGENSSDTETTPNVAVFTLRGLKGGKPHIEVRPIPSQDQTAYLHYQEKATLANLDRLPEAWTKVLFHLTMSLVANPQETPSVSDKIRWKAMTTAHEEQFRRSLADMIRLEEGAADESREFEIDDHLLDQVEEINDLSV